MMMLRDQYARTTIVSRRVGILQYQKGRRWYVLNVAGIITLALIQWRTLSTIGMLLSRCGCSE